MDFAGLVQPTSKVRNFLHERHGTLQQLDSPGRCHYPAFHLLGIQRAHTDTGAVSLLYHVDLSLEHLHRFYFAFKTEGGEFDHVVDVDGTIQHGPSQYRSSAFDGKAVVDGEVEGRALALRPSRRWQGGMQQLHQLVDVKCFVLAHQNVIRCNILARSGGNLFTSDAGGDSNHRRPVGKPRALQSGFDRQLGFLHTLSAFIFGEHVNLVERDDQMRAGQFCQHEAFRRLRLPSLVCVNDQQNHVDDLRTTDDRAN
mmetsp:Transcript_2783/g.7770  ORF Transcript_2783/g.7770 Transcript_2783/m.7770 type:complete len:255 (-) Transcript_2783:381-1145(-)